MIFPTFVRASHESAQEQEQLECTSNYDSIGKDNTHTKETKNQNSLLQLVIEANGQLSRVPQRTPAERSNFSKTLWTEQEHYEQHHTSQDQEDNQEHESQPVIITHTSWTPPTYLLDACFNPEFITRYYNMHGITCSRLQPSSSGSNSAKHAEYYNKSFSQGHSYSNKYKKDYNDDNTSDNEDNMLTNAHNQLPPPPLLRLHDLQLPATILNNLQRILLRRKNYTSFEAKAHNFLHVKENSNYDKKIRCRHEEKSVALTGIQSCALPNALLGDHVMFCGPPTCGKTTAALLATACNLLSAQGQLVATSESQKVPTNANNDIKVEQEELENWQGRQHHTTIRSAEDNAFTEAYMKSINDQTISTSNSQISPQGLIFVSSFQHLLQCVRWLCDTFGNDAFSFYTFARNSTSLEPFQLRGAKYMTTNNITLNNQRNSVSSKNDLNNNNNVNKEEKNLQFVNKENTNEYTACLEPSFAELLSLVHGAADKKEETEKDDVTNKNNNDNNEKIEETIKSKQECREHGTTITTSEEENDRLDRRYHTRNDKSNKRERRRRSRSSTESRHSVSHSSYRHRRKRDRNRYSREHSSSNSAHKHSLSVHQYRHHSNHHQHHHHRHHHSEHSSEHEGKERKRHDRYDEYDSENRKHSPHHHNTDDHHHHHHHHHHKHQQNELQEGNKYTHDNTINDYNNNNNNNNNFCKNNHVTSLPDYTNDTHNAKRTDATWKCLSSRLPLLFCTFHAFTEALQLTDNNCALLPLEHVKIVTIMHAERLLSLSSSSFSSAALLPFTSPNNTNNKNFTTTSNINKQHSSYSAWLGLSNAVDVECQYLLTCNRNETEVKEVIENTLVPDAGDRLVMYTQHDETIWPWCDLRIEPVTVQVENSNNKNDDNDKEELWTKLKAERRYTLQDATQRERTSARHKVLSEDIDVAKITHTATLVIEHLMELSEVSSHETALEQYTGPNGTNRLNRNEYIERSNSNINSIEDVTAFSESAHSPPRMPQVVIFVATRREQQLLLDQLSPVLRESAHLHPRAALLQVTDNLYSVFVEHIAHVAIVTDMQLTDDKVFGILSNSIHAQYANLMHTDDRCATIADNHFYSNGNTTNSNNNHTLSSLLCIHFSLPREILHNALPEQIREVMAFRMRALLGKTHNASNYVCSLPKEDNIDNYNKKNNLHNININDGSKSNTENCNKITVVLLMTEHHMRGVIGTRIEKALHSFLHKSIAVDDELWEEEQELDL